MNGNIEHQTTEICHFVDKLLTHLPLAQWSHSPHAQPRFSDDETLAIALLQGALEVAPLKQTSRLVARIALFLLAATYY